MNSGPLRPGERSNPHPASGHPLQEGEPPLLLFVYAWKRAGFCIAHCKSLNDGDRHARGRKPRSQRRAHLAGPDDDCIELAQHETPPLTNIEATLGRRADPVVVAHGVISSPVAHFQYQR